MLLVHMDELIPKYLYLSLNGIYSLFKKKKILKGEFWTGGDKFNVGKLKEENRRVVYIVFPSNTDLFFN